MQYGKKGEFFVMKCFIYLFMTIYPDAVLFISVTYFMAGMLELFFFIGV